MQKFLKAAEEASGGAFSDLDAVGLEDLDIEGRREAKTR